MLGLFKRKSPSAKLVRAQAPADKKLVRETTGHEWNAIQTSEDVMRLLATYMRTGVFQGAFDDAPGYVTKTTPNGMQIASSNATRTGAVLAEQAAGLSMAAVAPMQVAMVCLDTTFAHYLKTKPEWHRTKHEAGTDFTCQIPLVAPRALSVECKAENVDPLFNGQSVPGTTLLLKIVSIS